MKHTQEPTNNLTPTNVLPADAPQEEIPATSAPRPRRYWLLALGLLLAFAGIAVVWQFMKSDKSNKHATAAPVESAKTETRPTPPDVVEAEEREMPQISVEPVAEKTVAVAAETTGKVSFNEERMTPVFTPYAGRVVELLVNKGATVRAGQPLLILESPDLVAVQNDFAAARSDEHKAQIAVEAAQKVVDRAKRLHEREAIATKEVQQAETDLERAWDDLRRAQAAIKVQESRIALFGRDAWELAKVAERGKGLDQRVTIRAPIGGTIVDRKVGLGQYIKPDAADPLCLISDLSTLWVMADVYETWLPQIRVGAPVQISVAADPNHTLPAHISFINPTVDPASRTVHVRCTVNNSRGVLKPEMFARIQIGAATPQTVKAVPSNAIITQGADAFVFVELGQRRFKRHKIQPGRALAGFTEVNGDVKAGDRVVTHGVMLLNMQIKAEVAADNQQARRTE